MMRVLSRLAFPHSYAADSSVQDIDDGIESDAIELKGIDGVSLYVFPGAPVPVGQQDTGITACSLYDEEGQRVGILEKQGGSEEAVLLFQARYSWSTFFQDWDFEASSMTLGDLYTDRQLQLANMWVRNYGDTQQITVEQALADKGPFLCVPAETQNRILEGPTRNIIKDRQEGRQDSHQEDRQEGGLGGAVLPPSEPPAVADEVLKGKRIVFLDADSGIATYKQSFSIGFHDLPLQVQQWLTLAMGKNDST